MLDAANNVEASVVELFQQKEEEGEASKPLKRTGEVQGFCTAGSQPGNHLAVIKRESHWQGTGWQEGEEAQAKVQTALVRRPSRSRFRPQRARKGRRSAKAMHLTVWSTAGRKGVGCCFLSRIAVSRTDENLRGLWREWLGCDGCSADFHYGCAHDNDLRRPGARPMGLPPRKG
jgi:hypothetical protein